jgi:hypothetical protein
VMLGGWGYKSCEQLSSVVLAWCLVMVYFIKNIAFSHTLW